MYVHCASAYLKDGRGLATEKCNGGAGAHCDKPKDGDYDRQEKFGKVVDLDNIITDDVVVEHVFPLQIISTGIGKQHLWARYCAKPRYTAPVLIMSEYRYVKLIIIISLRHYLQNLTTSYRM